VKIVLVDDDGHPVAEIDQIEQYDLSTTRGRAMLIDDILVALGQADRRKVLDFIRDHKPEDGANIASIVSEVERR
jgi:hypothetical protein